MSISLEPLDRSLRNSLWPWLSRPVAALLQLCTSGYMDDVTFGRSGPPTTTSGIVTPGRALVSMNDLFETVFMNSRSVCLVLPCLEEKSEQHQNCSVLAVLCATLCPKSKINIIL